MLQVPSRGQGSLESGAEAEVLGQLPGDLGEPAVPTAIVWQAMPSIRHLLPLHQEPGAQLPVPPFECLIDMPRL